jgi:hypothetical protein
MPEMLSTKSPACGTKLRRIQRQHTLNTHLRLQIAHRRAVNVDSVTFSPALRRTFKLAASLRFPNFCPVARGLMSTVRASSSL